MTLEEINEIEDKDARLKLLVAYITARLQSQHDEEERVADDEMNASRDEAFGMMSRYGKPE
jgi:hypothetical protein